MSNVSLKQVAGFGTSVVERLLEEFRPTQVDDYPELQDIKNLQGESTGYVRVYQADKLTKATHLSINVAPGARYFNIHFAPEAHYNVPRFSLEGMVTVKGSQISLDMYPDLDLFMEIVPFLERMQGVAAVFDEAKQTDIDFRPSRLAHMRAFCSPFFLNAYGVNGEQLQAIDGYANRYLDEWLKLLAAAEKTDEQQADDRQRRRTHMSDIVIAADPDRQMIVQVYGEETTSAIETAVMYW